MTRICVRPISRRYNRLAAVGQMQMSSFNNPVHQNDLPRPAGIASFMRLPIQETAEGLDVCFVGVPFDTATSNR